MVELNVQKFVLTVVSMYNLVVAVYFYGNKSKQQIMLVSNIEARL